MVVDEYGRVGYTQEEVVDYLKINPDFNLESLFVIDGEQYLHARKKTNLDVTDHNMPEISLWSDRSNDCPLEEYHKILQSHWLMPDGYANMDIKKWLRTKALSAEQLQRVDEELKLYEEFDLINLLKYLKYLRDTADKNNIVWGVGRGSSCCSYCLFLMGIHRVDSLQFDLNIGEFLR